MAALGIRLPRLLPLLLAAHTPAYTMSAPRILVLGGTGYIGGSVLASLLASPPHGSVIATLTSSAAKADTIRAWAEQQAHPLDVLVADGRGDDWYAAVEQHAGAADVVVQAATSDDLRLTQAVNAGLQAARQQGRLGGLVHLSGCVVCGYAARMAADLLACSVQVIESEPVGKDVPTKDFDDASLADIQGIPDSAAHREIDLE